MSDDGASYPDDSGTWWPDQSPGYYPDYYIPYDPWPYTPVEPTTYVTYSFTCPNCGRCIQSASFFNYCPYCGHPFIEAVTLRDRLNDVLQLLEEIKELLENDQVEKG